MAYKYASTLLLLCAAAGSAAANRNLLQTDGSFTGNQCFYSSAKQSCLSNVFYTMTLQPSTVATDK